MISAAISQLKRLRFSVIVLPPENRRSDAADDACTARYLRDNLATVGKFSNVVCFPVHLKEAADDFHTVETDLLLVP